MTAFFDKQYRQSSWSGSSGSTFNIDFDIEEVLGNDMKDPSNYTNMLLQFNFQGINPGSPNSYNYMVKHDCLVAWSNPTTFVKYNENLIYEEASGLGPGFFSATISGGTNIRYSFVLPNPHPEIRWMATLEIYAFI
jgi:hypothetical protein